MKDQREIPKSKEQQRLEQIRFIMDHWDELPENMQCRFEGQIQTARDFLAQETS